MKYTITPIKAGLYGPVSENILFVDGSPSVTHMLPSMIFHLQSETEAIVVDASFSFPGRCITVMNRVMALDVQREKHLSLMLQAKGIDPLAVTKVILTHYHWDHAGGTYAFPNARIYLQKVDWEFAMADQTLAPEFREELLSMKRRLILVDGTDKSVEGIEMVRLGGHTVGSQILYIDTDEGRVIIAGDLVMRYRNIEEHVPIGLGVNPEECKSALDLIIASGCKVYCGHEDSESKLQH